MKLNLSTMIVSAIKALGAFLCVVFLPIMYPIYILFFAHLIDVVSAIRLNIRLYKKDPEKYKTARITSTGFKRLIFTIGFELLIIFLAAIIQMWVIPSIAITSFVIYLMIFSQVVSILENESTANGSKWALTLQKIFKSKAAKYLSDKLGMEDSCFKELDLWEKENENLQ